MKVESEDEEWRRIQEEERKRKKTKKCKRKEKTKKESQKKKYFIKITCVSHVSVTCSNLLIHTTRPLDTSIKS